MPTRVDREALERIKPSFPPRLRRFLDNFFGSCESFDLQGNYINYMSDVDGWAGDPSARVYKQHRERLRKAFYEITGQARYKWKPYADKVPAKSDDQL